MSPKKTSSDTVLNENPLDSPNKFKGSNLAIVRIEPEDRNSTRIVETITRFIFGLYTENSTNTALVCLSIHSICCKRLKLPCKKLNLPLNS